MKCTPLNFLFAFHDRSITRGCTSRLSWVGFSSRALSTMGESSSAVSLPDPSSHVTIVNHSSWSKQKVLHCPPVEFCVSYCRLNACGPRARHQPSRPIPNSAIATRGTVTDLGPPPITLIIFRSPQRIIFGVWAWPATTQPIRRAVL